MPLGYAVVWTGLGLALGSVLAYAGSARKPMLQKVARFCFVASVLMIFAAEGVLQYLLIAGRYEIAYVFNFSERALPLWYKIAGGWAGQEGSFLLWTVWTGIYGLLLLKTAGGYERHVMGVYGVLIATLMGILAYQSPFFPLQDVPPGMEVRDGFGLNPSLENIWMTIHPPIIFAGFAALAVPFAYALAALLRNEYQEWVIRVRPWAIYATTMLGTGLALGGFWAYETLGWGGFWAWDPVENCSYFPWLASAAFLHALMLQVNRGRLTRWNPLLGALPFLMFVYGTFLTRSGLLADVSVHSFVSMEKQALWVLIFMMGVGTFGTLGLWLARWRRIPRPVPLDPARGVSREGALKGGVLLLSLSAWVTLVATSYPLISQLVQGRMSKLEPPFYNQVHAPWIVVTAILMAVTPFIMWRGMKFEALLERITKVWLTTLLFAFVVYWFGLRQPVALLVVTLLFFAVVANFASLWRRVRRSRVTIGGFVAHAGLAITIIGLIISNVYEVKKEVVVAEGHEATAFGYRWRYLGMTADPFLEKQNRVRVEVANHQEKFIAAPRYYLDTRQEEPKPVFWPWIRRWWNHDLYVSFFASPQVDADPLRAQLKEEGEVRVEPYQLRFLGFTTAGAMGAEGFRAGAKVEVRKTGWEKPVVVEPAIQMRGGRPTPQAAALPDGAFIRLSGMSVDERQVRLEIVNVPGRPETMPRFWVPLEVYYKPFTILVWLGPPLTLLGGLLAVRRRALDGRHALKKLEQHADLSQPTKRLRKVKTTV